MSVVLTRAELNTIWATKTAQLDYVYACEDGMLYRGQRDGTLLKVPNTNRDDWQRQVQENQSLPHIDKTVIQGVSTVDGSILDIKVNPDGSAVIGLPEGAATEATQLEILNELNSSLSSSNTQVEILTEISEGGATKLNQYTQLELLNLMYEELQQINKTLKKIYQ